MSKAKEKGKFQSLGKRLLMAAVWVAILLVVFLKLPFWVTGIIEMLAAAFMAYELSVNSKLIKNKPLCILSIIQAAIIPWMIYFESDLYIFFAIVFIFVSLMFLTEVISENKSGLLGMFAAFFSAYVFPLFISLLVPIMRLDNGRNLVIIPFVASWCSDAMAYFIGSAFGKHKLAPSISPKKSVEGMIGGFAGGIIGMLIYGVILTLCGQNVEWLTFIIFGLLGSVFGQSGDLFLSYIKRECKIKDFGNFLPGHGGVLDRFDSTLFVVPICYFIFKLL